MKNIDLKRRIIDISYKHHLSHLGSCLSSVDIIDDIYRSKKKDEPFILSAGHAGLALYVVLEKYEGKDAEKIFSHHGVHPDRCTDCGIYAGSGSLGQGLPISLGVALTGKTVHCLISDGETAEGSIWESLRIAWDFNISNLKIYINMNGYGAYGKIDQEKLKDRLGKFHRKIEYRQTNVEQLPFLTGQSAHYIIMSDDQYKEAMSYLSK